ncbi:helix-turn-helix transcriptional regulator [Riemerella columbina]|uniref:helix-turn-helix transcriptional regulator n=1 Tax=Riemerella columbina TaxID=103810 RepID=UPI002670AD8A|nr:WYL domain-containing protein [Riemerella columbina]WKS95344.1 WYL domain-containing protein [Riemerella columbina]
MSTTKNAQLRYKALDQCFSNFYKKFFIEDLMQHCSEVLSEHFMEEKTISRRQIFDDMNFMKSAAGFEAPIESIKEGRKTYYRYDDPNFSILKKPMTATERETLQEALETLGRLNTLPGFDWVKSLQAKLDAELQPQAEANPIIDFEENAYLKGLEFLHPLYQYISKKIPVEIVYKSFQAEQEQRITFSPYFLKQYNNRWFLFGWNHAFETIQNMALDRVLSIGNSGVSYQPSTFDFVDYFDEIIGVTNPKNAPVETIEIQLSDRIIPYITSKPLHGSQKIKGNYLTISVKINYELISLILSHRENMTVLSPPALVAQIKDLIEKMKKNYECR